MRPIRFGGVGAVSKASPPPGRGCGDHRLARKVAVGNDIVKQHTLILVTLSHYHCNPYRLSGQRPVGSILRHGEDGAWRCDTAQRMRSARYQRYSGLGGRSGRPRRLRGRAKAFATAPLMARRTRCRRGDLNIMAENLTVGPRVMAGIDPKRAFRLLAWISRLDQDLPGGRWSDLNDWSQVSGVMVADHRPARASAFVAATNAFFAFL